VPAAPPAFARRSTEPDHRGRPAARGRRLPPPRPDPQTRPGGRHRLAPRLLEKERLMKIFWFIPTHGDSRYLGTAEGARTLNHDYLKQVAQAADSLGYEGVLIPT